MAAPIRADLVGPLSGLAAAQRAFFFLLIAQSALLPLVPDKLTFQTASFSATFGVLWLFWLTQPCRDSTSRRASLALGLFLLAVFFSCPIAIANGTSFGEWLRGCTPFLFLSIFYTLASARGATDALFILNALQGAALVWAVKILVVSSGQLSFLFSGTLDRLTYVTLDTLIPFGLLGFIVSLYNPSRFARRWRVVCVALFAFLILACAYRSQIVLCALATLGHPRLRRYFPLIALVAVVASTLPLGEVFPTSDVGPFGSVASRFHRLSEIRRFEDLGTRAHEIRCAFGLFLESPIWGNGLGCPVPTYYVYESAYHRYIHNVWLYLLMDMGLIGLTFYVLFLVKSLRPTAGSDLDPQAKALSRAQRCARMSIVGLILYATCQAAFRGIQFNLMLAALSIVATSTSSDTSASPAYRIQARG